MPLGTSIPITPSTLQSCVARSTKSLNTLSFPLLSREKVPPERASQVAVFRRPDACTKSRQSGSSLSRSALIRALRFAPLVSNAIERSRASNHGTSSNSKRSHGGLPITASKPPCCSALDQSVHTPGNATCQWRNRSSAISARARSRMAANRSPSAGARSHTGSTRPSAMNTGSPNSPSSYARTAGRSSRPSASQSSAARTDRNTASGAVCAWTP